MSQTKPNQWPTGQYELGDKAYIGRTPDAVHEFLQKGTVIVYDGRPGPHMIPMDAGAKQAVAMVEASGGFGSLDPTQSLPLTMQPDVADQILRDSLGAANAEIAALKARLAVVPAPVSVTEVPSAVPVPAPAPVPPPPAPPVAPVPPPPAPPLAPVPPPVPPPPIS